jgi:hypothetical protein
MTTLRIPTSAASATTSSVASVGTMMKARSTGSPMAVSDGLVAWPCTVSRPGWTTWTVTSGEWVARLA